MAIKRIFSRFITAKKVVTNNLIGRGFYSKNTHKELIVLMYHGIDKVEDTRFNQRFFSKASFEKHIRSFKQHFHILDYSDYLDNNLSATRPNLLLTFDDGYANNYNYALPILEKYNAHAFFFITGLNNVDKKVLWADAVDIVSTYAKEGSKVSLSGLDFIFRANTFFNIDTNVDLPTYIRRSNKKGYAEKESLAEQLLGIYDFTKHPEFDDYWQLMTDEQIRKAAQSRNITVGSHGYYHNNLGSLSNNDAVDEVMLSKNYLENIIQKPVNTIGFPDGSYTGQLNDSLFEKGFIKQFVVDFRYGDDGKRSFTTDRFGLYPNMGNTHKIVYKILHQ